MQLILASTSPYRRQLLARLGQAFECHPPGTDESVLPGEEPGDLAGRLAEAKARAVAQLYPDALVIGSDQVAALGTQLLGKPGNHGAAVDQLRLCSGREVQFFTGLTVMCANRGFVRQCVEPFSVYFRSLSEAEIEDYLQREQPYDCAGSFKCEGLGISLFTRLSGDDPTSLEGLPLIRLSAMLRAAEATFTVKIQPYIN
jgi:septum formation protein